jgi:hypothetical protein
VTTVRLPAQYLTTKDDVRSRSPRSSSTKSKDVEPYITGIFDQHDVLCDVTMGAIRKHVAESGLHRARDQPARSEGRDRRAPRGAPLRLRDPRRDLHELHEGAPAHADHPIRPKDLDN